MKLRSLVATVAIVVGVVVGAFTSATAAQAAVTCSWYVVGDASYCDDTDPWGSDIQCGQNGAYVARSATLSSSPSIKVYLWYSPAPCRTVWAELHYDGSAVPGVCYVKVHRNSDNEALYDYSADRDPHTGTYIADSKQLYDAGVTSYAWGRCDVGGRSYTGRTTNY